MSISKNISKLRKLKGLSQEAVAESLNVSRQAVSKWKTGQSTPDTKNLIRLSELLGVTVEKLTNKDIDISDDGLLVPEKDIPKRRTFKKSIISTLGIFIIIMILAIGLVTHFAPVKWEFICSGGYATAIFDKYNERLMDKFISGSDRKEYISDCKVIRGTHEIEYQDRNLTLFFNVTYYDKELGDINERVQFIGKRVWI